MNTNTAAIKPAHTAVLHYRRQAKKVLEAVWRTRAAAMNVSRDAWGAKLEDADAAASEYFNTLVGLYSKTNAIRNQLESDRQTLLQIKKSPVPANADTLDTIKTRAEATFDALTAIAAKNNELADAVDKLAHEIEEPVREHARMKAAELKAHREQHAVELKAALQPLHEYEAEAARILSIADQIYKRALDHGVAGEDIRRVAHLLEGIAFVHTNTNENRRTVETYEHHAWRKDTTDKIDHSRRRVEKARAALTEMEKIAASLGVDAVEADADPYTDQTTATAEEIDNAHEAVLTARRKAKKVREAVKVYKGMTLSIYRKHRDAETALNDLVTLSNTIDNAYEQLESDRRLMVDVKKGTASTNRGTAAYIADRAGANLDTLSTLESKSLTAYSAAARIAAKAEAEVTAEADTQPVEVDADAAAKVVEAAAQVVEAEAAAVKAEAVKAAPVNPRRTRKAVNKLTNAARYVVDPAAKAQAEAHLAAGDIAAAVQVMDAAAKQQAQSTGRVAEQAGWIIKACGEAAELIGMVSAAA